MTLGSGSVVLQRRLKIADWIRRHGVTRVEALSDALGVSVVTIRGDLAYLEEQGLVVRSAGRARPNPASTPESARPNGLSRSESRPLLLAAAEIASRETTVLLGAGPLVTQLIPHLRTAAGFNLILSELDALGVARSCTDGSLHLLGGQLDRASNRLEGPQTMHALGLFSIDLFVMQAHAVVSGAVMLQAGASDAFHRAASLRAVRTLALIDGDSLDPPMGLPRLDLDRLDHVILRAGSHHEATRFLLDAGFRQGRLPDSAALLYEKAKQAP